MAGEKPTSGSDLAGGLEAVIPGPQKRGTGGTLVVVWKGLRDRGHPPRDREHPRCGLERTEGSGPPAAIIDAGMLGALLMSEA